MSEAFVVFGLRGTGALSVTLIDDETLAHFNLRKCRLFSQNFPFQYTVYGVYFTINELYMIQDHLQFQHQHARHTPEKQMHKSPLSVKLENMLLSLNAFASHFGFTTTPNFHVGIKGQIITDLFTQSTESPQKVYDNDNDNDNNSTPQNTPELTRNTNLPIKDIVCDKIKFKTTVVRFRILSELKSPPRAPVKFRRKVKGSFVLSQRTITKPQNAKRKLSFNHL